MKIIGSLVLVVLVILTLNDMEGMKNVFNLYAWLVVVLGGLAGVFLLGVSIISNNKEVFKGATEKLTEDSASVYILNLGITGYLMYSYGMGLQLVLYIIYNALYCLSMLIFTIRK